MAKKIMLIDDDPGIGEVVKIIMEDNGYIFIAADIDSQEKAVKLVEEQQPDLVLLDLWMPGVDGGELCGQLKINPKTKKIPIVLLSASINTQKIAEKSKADAFLAKPFEMDELVAMVQKMVGQN